LIGLSNNVIEQLILGLGKLMEETLSVFWVDLGYRLCSRDRVPLQVSGMTDIPYYYCYIVAVVPGGTA